MVGCSVLAIVKVFNDPLDKVIPALELTEMIKSSEDLELFQQPRTKSTTNRKEVTRLTQSHPCIC